ncbi:MULTISPECIES: hypothetical protein [Pseudomonas]|uniref:Uncharacterized protein n=1 Tax=Pseudomonas asiatica TaxID=2219225 RepID=A0AAJ5LCU2_9PSED|nr:MULTISPECIES: hypothetical protein [Pseudomonas]UUC18207.1 hypothetical protein NOV18_23600 [Pseudomonas asiatica]
MTVKGIDKCRAAFERLKAGEPHVAAHVGLDPTKITAGVVSVEAGFDRGYLKKERASHRALLADIEAYRKSYGTESSSKALQVKRANDKAAKALSDLEIARGQLHHVMAQNVQLVERVRELQFQLDSRRNVTQLKPGAKKHPT